MLAGYIKKKKKKKKKTKANPLLTYSCTEIMLAISPAIPYLYSLEPCLVGGSDQDVEWRFLCQGRVVVAIEAMMVSARVLGNVGHFRF